MLPKQLLLKFVLTILGLSVLVGGVVALTLAVPWDWYWVAMFAGSAFAGACILTIGLLLERQHWILPSRHLEEVTAKMTNGDWSERADPQGGASQMANHLNLLAAQVQKQLSDLQQQRGGLRALMDTMPDPIVAADAQGRIVLLNAPAALLLSVSPYEVLNQKLVNVVNDEQIVQLYEALLSGGKTQNAGDAVQREIRLVRGGQRLIYQAVARRMVSGSCLLVLRDVSALANAVQMKTDFVANASHELRTPIAAIKIAFETLREVVHDDPNQTDRCISVIDSQLRRLEEMLRDLMDLSRVEASELKPHMAKIKTSDLLAVLRSSLGTLARQKNVELSLDDHDPAAATEIYTDTRLFNLLVKNLVENSVKFTPAGGKVSVTIRQAEPSEMGGGEVTLTVADTGIGIAREHLDRVFERFYQVDSARSGSAGRGSGLGLAIVKHAAYALGGSVKLDSMVGVGTTITCLLPQPTEESPPQAQPAVA
jgi:two-component system, OmpR family, phosphate regulon sensor histidine kinase PhoR